MTQPGDSDSDRVVLGRMLERAGVVYLETDEGDVEVRAKDGPRNLGYADFVTEFRFDDRGQLLTVTVWE